MSWAHAQSDQVLYSLRRKPLFDGKFGKLAEAQAAIGAALVRCGKTPLLWMVTLEMELLWL